MKSLDVFISLPTSYVNPITLERENLIDISSVTIKSLYNNQLFNIEWTQNNTILILDAIESTTTTTSAAPVEDYNGMQFDASRIGLEYDLSGGNQNADTMMGERRRRSVLADQDAYFNPYLQKVIRSDGIDSSFAWESENQLDGRYKRDIFNSNDRLLANLPTNRTIYFDCKNAEQDLCLVGKFTITNFKADNSPILITLNFTVNLGKVAAVLSEKRDILVIRTSADLRRTSSEDVYVFSLV